MAWPKGKPRGVKPPGSGRKKGSHGSKGAATRDMIIDAFLAFGGGPAFAVWAKENATDFYTKLYAKLIPVEQHLSGPNGEPIPIEHTDSRESLLGRIDRVIASRSDQGSDPPTIQ
jgi:hypothetical protein